MLSRMAESLYWIGRYVERAEDTARITEVTYNHTLEMGSTAEAEARSRRHWEALLAIVGDRPRFFEHQEVADEDTVPPYLTFATDNPNSIVSCIAAARENARTMRHQIASEMWEAINRFHLELARIGSSGQAARGADNAYLFYRSVMDFSHLFQGITDSTMPREEGWYFLQTGKFLERAEKTARALDVKYHLLCPEEPHEAASADDLARDSHQWISVLRSLSAYETYYRISTSGVRPRSVVEMLILNPVVPRSIRFAVGKVERALRHITEDAAGYNGTEQGTAQARAGEARRAIGRLDAELAYRRIAEIFDAGLHAYLIDVQRQCFEVGEHINEEFFAHRPLTAEEVVAG
jgi:uncharacterized alpha-E superfamily protein